MESSKHNWGNIPETVCYLSNVTFDQAVFLTIVHVVDGWESNKNAKTLNVFFILSIFRF